MKTLVIAAVAALALTGCAQVSDAVDSAVNVGQQAVEVGQQAVEVGQQAVEAGQGAIDSGRELVQQGQDIMGAADDLQVACDLVREAVAPGTSPEESASLFQQAMAIVGGVVAAYPDVPGIADLEAGLGAARAALAADPSGQSLGITRDAVEAQCSRIPSLG